MIDNQQQIATVTSDVFSSDGFLKILGSVGGLYTTLFAVFSVVVGFYSKAHFTKHIVNNLFLSKKQLPTSETPTATVTDANKVMPHTCEAAETVPVKLTSKDNTEAYKSLKANV